MTKRINLLAIIVFALLLSACAADAPAPTATLTEPTALLSTNSQVTYQPTFTITPSLTLRPTQTPYQTPTITPSPIPWPTNTPLPYPRPEAEYYSFESISPNKKWIAWRLRCEENWFDFCFQFINADGTQSWEFTVEDIVTQQDQGVRGEVLNWSPDNKFAYIVTYPMDIDPFYDMPATGIAKISLVNGVITNIITPVYTYDEENDYYHRPFYHYAFSNNGQWLVYAQQNERSMDFTLLDLVANEVQYFSVIVEEYYTAHNISWLPDDTNFVFSLSEAISEDDYSFSIVGVNLENLSVKRILVGENIGLEFVEWISNKEIKYMEYDRSGNAKTLIILNIETGEITEIAD